MDIDGKFSLSLKSTLEMGRIIREDGLQRSGLSSREAASGMGQVHNHLSVVERFGIARLWRTAGENMDKLVSETVDKHGKHLQSCESCARQAPGSQL